MAVSSSETTEAAIEDLGGRLLGAAIDVGGLDTPEGVLDRLDQVTYPGLNLRALVASRFPLKTTDWSSRTLGRNTFLHRAASVLSFKALNDPGLYSDGRGLWLQVSKTGVKAWLFRYVRHGRARAMGLGPLHTVGLKGARDRAQQQLLDGKLQ